MSDDRVPEVDEVARSEARARASKKLEFYKHVLAYVVVISGLAAINLSTGGGYLWFVWPALGWGVGLLVHAINVFVFSDKVLRRMTEREMRHAGPRAGSQH